MFLRVDHKDRERVSGSVDMVYIYIYILDVNMFV